MVSLLTDQEGKMDKAQLETEINAAWDDRDNVSTQTGGAVREACARRSPTIRAGRVEPGYIDKSRATRHLAIRYHHGVSGIRSHL